MNEKTLEQILSEIQGMKVLQEKTYTDLQDVKPLMENRFDTLETKVSQVQDDVTNIKKSVNRIEKNEPEDIFVMLKQINNKLDNKDSDVVALNKRLFRVESTIVRMENQ